MSAILFPRDERQCAARRKRVSEWTARRRIPTPDRAVDSRLAEMGRVNLFTSPEAVRKHMVSERRARAPRSREERSAILECVVEGIIPIVERHSLAGNCVELARHATAIEWGWRGAEEY